MATYLRPCAPPSAMVASTSAPSSVAYLPARAQRLSARSCRRPLQVARASTSRNSAGSSGDFQARAAEFAEEAQRRVKDFVKEQQLDAKAAAAGKDAQQKLADLYEETRESMRRTYMQLDSTYNIQDNLDKTAKRVTETAQDIDQQFSVRRKLKNAAGDVQRQMPRWKRQFGEFSATSGGKATLTLVFVSLLLSGALWQVLNLVWLLWWLSVPVGLYFADRTRREQQQAAASSSNSSGRAGSGGFWGSSSSSYASSSSSSQGRRGGYSSGGPVVDAEWTSLDEGDSSRRRR